MSFVDKVDVVSVFGRRMTLMSCEVFANMYHKSKSGLAMFSMRTWSRLSLTHQRWLWLKFDVVHSAGSDGFGSGMTDTSVFTSVFTTTRNLSQAPSILTFPRL